MKCRDMNPGNAQALQSSRRSIRPSMKCRDMNPGNVRTIFTTPTKGLALNEVPGYESRQFSRRVPVV